MAFHVHILLLVWIVFLFLIRYCLCWCNLFTARCFNQPSRRSTFRCSQDGSTWNRALVRFFSFVIWTSTRDLCTTHVCTNFCLKSTPLVTYWVGLEVESLVWVFIYTHTLYLRIRAAKLHKYAGFTVVCHFNGVSLAGQWWFAYSVIWILPPLIN